MKRSLICLILALIIPSPVFGQELHGTLKKIKETKTIALGYREASHPFSYLGDDKKPAGYSVDLCTRIVTDIRQQLWLPDLQIKWVSVVPENRIPLVVDGTIDIECGSTTNTLSRQEEVDFSYMTFVDGSSLLVTVASGIQTGSDLRGKRIALIPGTTTEKAVTEWLQKNYVTLQILKVKDHAEGLAALENGTADAYASDFTLLIGLGRTAKDPTKLTLFGQFFSYEPYGLMLRRDDSAFRLAVNRVLVRLYRSGQILDIYKRWFGSIGRPSDMLMAVYVLHSLQD